MTGVINRILCLDFDGVLHSYTSGWHGARTISDAPVPGALEFIADATEQFRVAILSSRSHAWGGRRAMKRWLLQEMQDAGSDYDRCPEWLRRRVTAIAFADPWEDDVRYVVSKIVGMIEWPLHKPSAFITIDDRALTFNGTWPSLAELHRFKPWNKRLPA